jgi:hypothetical protein
MFKQKPHLFLISPKSRVTVDMNDQFIEKIVNRYRTDFVEVMIAFKSSW